MSNLYEAKLQFSKSLGYKSYAIAVGDMGLSRFNKEFGESFIIITRKDTDAYPIEHESAGGVELLFDSNYLIFPDGRIWSIHNKMFLTYTKKNYKKGKIHYTYNLRGRKIYNIAKLVWLHFGVHDLEYYIDVGEITYKNGNPLEFGIENLIG